MRNRTAYREEAILPALLLLLAITIVSLWVALGRVWRPAGPEAAGPTPAAIATAIPTPGPATPAERALMAALLEIGPARQRAFNDGRRRGYQEGVRAGWEYGYRQARKDALASGNAGWR